MLESVFAGINKSKIITTHGIYFSKMPVIQLLNLSCVRFASTLEGRIQAIKKLTNYSIKTPILIDPNELGAFPTTSYKNIECVWIFHHPLKIESLSNGKSQVTFHNGMTFTVNASKYVLEKQKQRLHTIFDIYRMVQRDEDFL